MSKLTKKEREWGEDECLYSTPNTKQTIQPQEDNEVPASIQEVLAARKEKERFWYGIYKDFSETVRKENTEEGK